MGPDPLSIMNGHLVLNDFHYPLPLFPRSYLNAPSFPDISTIHTPLLTTVATSLHL
jgi:hypothetical protein